MEVARRGLYVSWASKHFSFRRLISADSAARVPEEQAARSGIAEDQVKIKEKYGGGYPAHVEGLHHLHCLVSTAVTSFERFDTDTGAEPFAEDIGMEHRVLPETRPRTFQQ